MKIKALHQKINSTLSCILKCLKFFDMIHKKILFGLITISFLGGCASPTAMIGPVYTLTSTGNIYQASLSYGSNEMITMYTGKTPLENVKEITMNSKNIHKQTLESEDFYILVKSKIDKTGAILKKSSR
jgi:hypothetical protein